MWTAVAEVGEGAKPQKKLKKEPEAAEAQGRGRDRQAQAPMRSMGRVFNESSDQAESTLAKAEEAGGTGRGGRNWESAQ